MEAAKAAAEEGGDLADREKCGGVRRLAVGVAGGSCAQRAAAFQWSPILLSRPARGSYMGRLDECPVERDEITEYGARPHRSPSSGM
jgi:hypothetical protein